MTQKIKLEIITNQKAIDNEMLEPAIVYIAALRGGFDTDSNAWSPPLEKQQGKVYFENYFESFVPEDVLEVHKTRFKNAISNFLSMSGYESVLNWIEE